MNKEELRDLLLDQLYFVTAFDTLKKELEWNTEYETELLSLLNDGWVTQLKYDAVAGDFVKQTTVSAQLEDFSYLATKKGLLGHIGL